jgi:hypothetical protein
VELARYFPAVTAPGHVQAFCLFDLQGSFRLALDEHGLFSITGGVLYVYLLLLCVAVSSYVRKGASATAAVRLILLLRLEEYRPSCLLWKWREARG